MIIIVKSLAQSLTHSKDLVNFTLTVLSFGFYFSCMKNKHAEKEPGSTMEHLTVLVQEMLTKQGTEVQGMGRRLARLQGTHPVLSNHHGHPVAGNEG